MCSVAYMYVGFTIALKFFTILDPSLLSLKSKTFFSLFLRGPVYSMPLGG